MPKGDDYKNNPDRFWEKVKVVGECWEWIAPRTYQNYGVVRIWFSHTESYQQAAHRFAWELVNGPIPVGLFVCHRCDNPPCVRPEHLFLGTQTDNLLDAVSKGRIKPHNARLTDEQRQEIVTRHTAGETCTALAEEFGVHKNYITTLKSRWAKNGTWSNRRAKVVS